MRKVLEYLFVVIKAIVVLVAVIVEFPIKLMATILFIALFIIMAFLAPIFNRISCPKWWEAYSDYATKWKNNWHIVTWVLKNYNY